MSAPRTRMLRPCARLSTRRGPSRFRTSSRSIARPCRRTSTATSLGIQQAFIDEHKQALGRRGTRHRNRGSDCGLCRRHERGAADDIHRGTGSVPSRVSHRPTRSSQSELASLERANEWLNSPPLTASALRGKVVLDRFLDLHLHQLAAHASLCSRLGREIQGSRTGGDRRPCTGVRI